MNSWQEVVFISLKAYPSEVLKEVPEHVHTKNYDGHPLKKIFELRVGGSISVTFPPVQLFGQVVKDMVLLPNALFDCLNRLKEEHTQKQRKKYQLRSTKCTIPFLEISQMDYDPGSKHSTGSNISRDEFRPFLKMQKF